MKKYYLFHSVEQKEYPKLSFEELLSIVSNSSNINDWLIWTDGYKDWTPLAQSPVYEMLFKSEKTNTTIKPPPIKLPPRSETVIKTPVAESSEMKSQTVIKSQPVRTETVAKSVSTLKPIEQNTVPKTVTTLKPIEQNTVAKSIATQKPIEQNTISKKIIPQENTLLKIKSVKQEPAPAIEVAEAWNKDERRKHPRIKTRLRVIITNNEKTFLTHCLDVSMGGLKVEKAIPKTLFNKECEIYICGADGKESIVFKCTPVGTEGNPNRLKFSEADNRYSEKLSDWLEQYKDYPVKKTNLKKVG
jgi:hypothetical protein